MGKRAHLFWTSLTGSSMIENSRSRVHSGGGIWTHFPDLRVPETRIDLVGAPAWSSGPSSAVADRQAKAGTRRIASGCLFSNPDACVREQGRRRRGCRLCRELVFVDQAAEQVTAADAIKLDHIGHGALAPGRRLADRCQLPERAVRPVLVVGG